MSGAHQNTPAAKPGRRGRKTAPRNPKPEQSPGPQADQLQPAEEPFAVTAAPTETAPIEMTAEPVAIEAAAAEGLAPVEAAATADTTPVEPSAPEDTPPAPADASAAAAAPVSLQTIASAYGDYTRRSLEETRSFVEQLKGAKSFGKAVEVQAEFAHHAFETFVAETQKIYGLHRELARQTLKPLEGLLNKPNRDQH